MATAREVALEQALVMVMGAAQHRGVQAEDLVNISIAMLVGNNVLRYVDHHYVEMAALEIHDALDKVLNSY